MEAVPPEALERLDESAVVGVEALRPGEDSRACELGEQLALARRVDVELVEEGGDRVVVAGQEAEPLEGVVERVVERACVVVE